MSISKMPNGRFRARLKSGRVGVASKVFDTRREAKVWLDRERAALAGGVDPRAGRERVRPLVQRWLEVRRSPWRPRPTVPTRTCRADQDLPRLMRTSMLALQWSTTGRGRRIHDLRHTAACLWLARGVDPGTVQAWMGHESIGTTNQYLHFLGTGADLVGLARLNVTPGDTGGTHRRETGG